MVIRTLEPLRQFREAVYHRLAPSQDAAFEIIDAIAASRDARSAVEVSLSPTMERKFSSVYKGVERTRIAEAGLIPLLTSQAETSGTLLFDGWALYALDHSPYPRQSAPTLSDRGYVHGAEGVVVGHQYSLLGRVMCESGSWVGLVDCQRIATHQRPTKVGAAQIARLKQHATQPRIVSADSEYVTDEILDEADQQTRLLIRFRSNRKLFGAPQAKVPHTPGRQPKHGEKLKLNREETLREPERCLRVEEADGGWTVISVWEKVHVGSRPDRPLCAVRVEVFRTNGQRRYDRPLWLAWTGPTELDWAQFWRVYLKRFCLECVHQFTKNSLAWTRGRFGYTGREERWTWLVMLAYWQLLLAAPVARDLCRPWEKPTAAGKLPTPGRVQRDYDRIFREVGSPTRSPKVRGIAPGRPTGYRPQPRPRFRVVYKGRNQAATT
jgi:DDE superfamily endonuclease